jgi:uncharacterized protein (TIGR02145 family)
MVFIPALPQDARKTYVDSLLNGIEVEKDICYNTGERPLLLDIYYPEATTREKHPCVIWIHGGGLTDPELDKNYDLVRWGAARTTLAGYLSVSIDYRLITEKPLPTAMRDCMDAIRFLKANAETYGIDTTRMAVVGESAGGYLTGLCSFTCNTGIFSTDDWTRVSNNFACGVLWYPAIDHWPFNMLDYVSPDDIPVISIHGDKDGIVSLDQSLRLQRKCREKGLDFKLHVIEGADHGFFRKQWDFDELTRKYTEQAIDITIAFLDEKLHFESAEKGEDFKTIKIGDQIWMAEDLSLDIGEGCWCYEDNRRICDRYGRLYTWDAAMKAAEEIPGWHLPGEDEWEELVRYIRHQEDSSKKNDKGRNGVGFHLKAKSRWHENGNGSDKYQFSAVPGGQKDHTGVYDGLGYYGHWWSSSKASPSEAVFRYMYNDMTVFDPYTGPKKCGFSVRLIKDR